MLAGAALLRGWRRRNPGLGGGVGVVKQMGSWASTRRVRGKGLGLRGRLVLAELHRRRSVLRGGGSGALGLLAAAEEKHHGRVREVRLGKVKVLG